MATRDEILKSLAVLVAAYPSAKITDAQTKVWLEMLSDLPPVALEAGVRSVVTTSTWFPSIADVRKAAFDALLGPVVSGGEAWAIACRFALGKGERPDAITEEAVEAVGNYHALRHHDNPTALRRQFIEVYDALASSARRIETKHPKVAALEAHTRKQIPEGES